MWGLGAQILYELLPGRWWIFHPSKWVVVCEGYNWIGAKGETQLRFLRKLIITDILCALWKGYFPLQVESLPPQACCGAEWVLKKAQSHQVCRLNYLASVQWEQELLLFWQIVLIGSPVWLGGSCFVPAQSASLVGFMPQHFCLFSSSNFSTMNKSQERLRAWDLEINRPGFKS